ncbi:toxin-antitoxin system TumE family protein [Caballeronia sp. J97]|uniref:toxin-antitoxin system TumE family protein n=1 Tax=Caballeronia sp. J97 TaxID=2805429 RepID=UPI002AB2C107|nr:DUF6516 family protein [Caballeronia sp. J97]
MAGTPKVLEYLTTHYGVVKMSNTKANLIAQIREAYSSNAFVEVTIWQVPQPVPGCTHSYKYRLAYVVSKVCVLRYDNEQGKGDHRHFVDGETPYEFSSVERIYSDFLTDVNRWNRWRLR